MTDALVRVLHISDIHCGRPFDAEHVAAAEALAKNSRLDAIVVSGDIAQRARVSEFRKARAILGRLESIAPTLVVPGNHDTAWWRAPFGVGRASRIHEHYRRYIREDLEPTLRLPGLSIVGLNSAGGMLPRTITWYPRDWRVKGGLTSLQLAEARARMEASPPGDVRVLVVHHNVVRGRISNRWGLARPVRTLDAIAAMSPHVVCSGHDHEERVELITRPTGQFIVSTAGTLSSRMRRHRPSSFSMIEADAAAVTVTAWVYEDGRFVPGPMSASLAR